MAQVRDSEELRIRLQQATGEDVLAFGWGNLGMKNVFDKVRLFADLGYIGGGDKEKGLGYSTGVALNGGFLFDL